MSVLDQQAELWAAQRRARGHDLNPPGGGGTSGDGMEPRIARLESDMEHVKRTLDDLKVDAKEIRRDLADGRDATASLRTDLVGRTGSLATDLARLEERVAHLPTKGFIVGATATSITIVGLLITFSEKIHALVH